MTAQRPLVALACFLFLVSIFLPFLRAQWFGLVIPETYPGPEYFWSFKQTYEYWDLSTGKFRVARGEWWFADYWSRIGQGIGTPRVWIPPLLICILDTQVFTVLLGVLAILKAKSRFLLISTVIFNVSTIFCMVLVSCVLDSWYLKISQPGFWLTLASATMFLAAFFLCQSRKPVARANPPIPY